MDSDDERTIFCGNISEKVTEELLYELFLQAAPIQSVKLPKDKEGRQQTYGFIIVKHKVSVPYVIELLNGTFLCDRKLNLKPRSKNREVPKETNGRPQDHRNNFPTPNFFVKDIDQLMVMGDSMLFYDDHNLKNDKPSSRGTYHERSTQHYREENRMEHNPYRYSSRTQNNGYYSNRRNYDNYDRDKSYHGRDRNRRKY